MVKIATCPSDVEVLLHIYYSATNHPREDAPAVQSALARFLRNGLIQKTGAVCPEYSVTELGSTAVKRIVDLDLYTKPDEPVSITMTRAEWEAISFGLSDVICWANGFIAGKGDDAGLMSIAELRKMNLKIKDAL